MTCKEKLMEICPGIDWGKVVVSECPSDYNWLCDPDYCSEHCRDGEFIESICEKCWNREIPGTEVKKENEEMNCKCEVVDMIKQLQFDNDTLMKECDELKKKLDEKSRLVDIYGARLDTKDVMLKKLNETNEDLANKLAEERARVDDKTYELSLYKKESQGLLDEVCDKNRWLNDQLNLKEKRIQELDTRNINLNEQINILRAEKETQAESIKDLLESNDKMKEDIEAKDKDIEYKQSLLDEICDNYNRLRTHIEEIGFKVDETDDSLTMEVGFDLNGITPKSLHCAQSPEDICHAIARLMYNKYDALVKAGFSHDDALSLIPMWTD